MTYRSVYVGIWLLFPSEGSERKKMILFVKVKENKIQICGSGALWNEPQPLFPLYTACVRDEDPVSLRRLLLREILKFLLDNYFIATMIQDLRMANP